MKLHTGPLSEPDRYTIEEPEPVGGGGEGLVFSARTGTADAGRVVALKMLTGVSLDAYPDIVERTEPLRQVEHPNLMRHVEVFVGTPLLSTPSADPEDFDLIFVVAEWVEGRSLSEAIVDVPAAEGLHWVGQIAVGVHHLHRLRSAEAPDGVLHRDLKPSNVRINERGEAVLLDFGLARPRPTSDATQGAGTAHWQAPEVVSGSELPGYGADAWGVGALAHWILTREPPRLDGTVATRRRLAEAGRQHGLGDPIGVANHIAGLLENDPSEREADLEKWSRQLRMLLDRRRRPYHSRGRVRVAAAVTAVTPVVVVLALGFVRSDDPRVPSSAPTDSLADTDDLSFLEDWTTPCDGLNSVALGAGATPKSKVSLLLTGEGEAWPAVVSSSPPSTRPGQGGVLGASTVERGDKGISWELGWLVESRSDGTFPVEWTCGLEHIGGRWNLEFEDLATGRTGAAVVEAVDPIETIGSNALPPGPDGYIHVPVGTVAEIEAQFVSKRPAAPPDALGLDQAVVVSSDPSGLEVVTLSPGVRYRITAKKPGRYVVTARLRQHLVEYSVAVDPI